ncbi:MAG: Holliday junction branch migration protein RuvA [Verrucomicrobiaceae bacterium]|nr:Holliday junction branch migration protein RuvA [Verrucomicrobiaceae bacterium]
MIAFVRGLLAESFPHHAIVDVSGVGYHLCIPLSTYDRLPALGAQVQLLTHYHVTDHSHTLYGFLTTDERDLFRLLIDRVSGVGPKLGLAVLSGMPVDAFKDAVVRGDTAALGRISGVGKKTAERIVLELKDKVGVTQAWQAASAAAHSDPASAAQADAVLALIALGYKQSEAQKTIQSLVKSADPGRPVTVDFLVKEALRGLN